MEQLLNKEQVLGDLTKTDNNVKRAIDLYYKEEPGISPVTNDLIKLIETTREAYLRIINDLIVVVENLETANRRTTHAYNVEKHRNNGTFTEN